MWEINPNPGKIRIYTSGWPKNQNKCWYNIGSPPPMGSKNLVFRLRSVNSMVIAPANTGRESSSSTAVMNTDHTNKGTISNFMLIGRIFKMVVIKLIAPKIDEAPAKWREKIVMSMAGVLWNIWFDKGG